MKHWGASMTQVVPHKRRPNTFREERRKCGSTFNKGRGRWGYSVGGTPLVAVRGLAGGGLWGKER